MKVKITISIDNELKKELDKIYEKQIERYLIRKIRDKKFRLNDIKRVNYSSFWEKIAREWISAKRNGLI